MNRTHPEQHIEILVVEDSATQAQLLAQLLQGDGYRVRIAVNGREGLRAARAAAPTMIVSDIAMPEMDGFEMCQEIKKDPALRDIPVILLTSLTSLYDVIKGLDCGADNFIRKPYDSTYLLGRIRFILANRALRSNERVQLGMQVSLGGQTHFITAERQQIFELLISTYEEAIQMTEQLKAQQARIAHSYQSLEGLYKIAEALNPALTEQSVGELALERIGDAAVLASLRAQRASIDLDYLMEDIPVLMAESREGISRVRKIVQDLKDFSRVDANQEWQWANLHAGIDSTLNIVSNEVKYKADVIKEYGQIPDIECQPSHINQVIMNIVINGAHAITAERGRITIRTGCNDVNVWIEIADNGAGIPKEILTRIFDPFFTTKPIGSGTGLGLSLSYGIIQKHSGQIDVRSAPGCGTTFRITLPIRRATEPAAQA